MKLFVKNYAFILSETMRFCQMEMLEHPVVSNLMRTGYPDGKEPLYPRCPICGAECNMVHRNGDLEIVGCDVCMSTDDAWEAPECFPEE